MQTTYTLDPAVAIAGQLGDTGSDRFVMSVIAETDLKPGHFVTLNASGRAIHPADDSGELAGVVLYESTREQSLPSGSETIKAGTAVNILRRGRVYCAFVSGTQTFLGNANISNGATAADRGKVTAQAVAANSVRAASGKVKFVRPVSASGLCLVEVNL